MKFPAGLSIVDGCFGRGWMKRCSSALLFVLALAAAPSVLAQATQVGTASVTACAANGSATVTIAGSNTTVPLGCLNQAQRTSPGTSDVTAGNLNVSILGLVNAANVSSVESIAQYANAPNTTQLTGSTQASSVSLAQGLVSANNVRGQLSCTADTGDRTLHCAANSTIGQMTIAGQSVTLPTPIPRNYTLPVQGNLTVTVLGLPVTVGVTGTAVLNEAVAGGVNSPTVTVRQHNVHLTLGGGTTIPGGQLLNVHLDLVDDVTASATVPNQGSWFTAVQIQ
ncbi:hypothetical protein [Trinickia diaoshuihuensis]|jgi:hypothetical protein|uniref:hypothetical protein n=1 Tax=Trinickia diaoshuihuensis TaxID=2292265 RepID=UPI0013C337ED|nr:hypothetical protein [Trinickia diaoshuihuensis]